MLYIVLSASNILCFLIGAIIGQRVVNKRDVINIKSPAQIIEEHQRKIEATKEEERLKAIADNIENYDGTRGSQKDIPK